MQFNLQKLRKDCLVIASHEEASCVHVFQVNQHKVLMLLADFANVTSSSYAVLDSGWVYQYERYNDKYCWIQVMDILQVSWQEVIYFKIHGIHASLIEDNILGITKLAFNPKQASRDDLYRARINPIVTFQVKEQYYLEIKLH